MDSTTFRILDALSRDPGREHSISGLVRTIKSLGHSGYYKNIYQRVQNMKGKKLLRIRKVGKTSLVSLQLDNPRTIDELSIMEIERKKKLRDRYPPEEEFIQHLGAENLTCLALIRPERNIKLNAAEILYLINARKGIKTLLKKAKNLAHKYNKAIYPLLLTEKEFQGMLESKEGNQVQELLKDKIVTINPARFWKIVSQTQLKEMEGVKIDPEQIEKAQIYYNLSRLGYVAFNKEPQESVLFNVETIILACIVAEEARLREAIPILLSKNKVNYRLLLFLALKYGKIENLGYLLEMTQNLIQDEEKKETLKRALNWFELFQESSKEVKTKGSLAKKWGIETRTTPKEIKEKMKEYHAI